MTPKRRRLYVVLGGMAVLSVAAALVLNAFEKSLVFFFSPSEVVEKGVPPDRRFRLGGLVEEASVVRGADGLTVAFRVTDLVAAVPVTFRGMLPDLFGEGQGVVVEGRLGADGVLVATQVLAKHDETYMPREVAEALKKSGRWQGAEEAQ